MILGRVVGCGWSTVKDPGLEGQRLLVVQPVTPELKNTGKPLVCTDWSGAGDGELADFYATLATAEERHAEIFIELARPLLPAADGEARIADLARRETEILAALPHASRIH